MNKVRGFEKVSFEQWDKDNQVIAESQDAWNSIKLPKRATIHAAGYDIFTIVDFVLEPTEEVLIPLGIKIYMLGDEFFMIAPRSGMGFKYYARLANTLGIIDSDYYNNANNEGHCWAKIRNEGNKQMVVRAGDAIAQGIFQKFLLADGDSLENGERRNGGLGSTDSKSE